MEEDPCSCRTTDAISSGQGELGKQRKRALLGNIGLFHRNQTKLPSMDVSQWRALLVHQWQDQPGQSAKKLAEEDEDVPAVQGIPSYSARHLRSGAKPQLAGGLLDDSILEVVVQCGSLRCISPFVPVWR